MRGSHRLTILSAVMMVGVGGSSSIVGLPAGRSCHAMSAAPRGGGGGIAVLGGARVCGRDVLADSAVWVWNGADWRQLPQPFPSAREDALVAHDSRRGLLVLYGGRRGTTVFTDTWEWDGTSWRSIPSAVNPGAVEHAAAAFDERRGRVVVFGGGMRGAEQPRATWEWDGTRWERRASAGPPPRVGPSMVWSPADDGVLLYGGFDDVGSRRDLWRWDGAAWARLDSAGPAFTEGPALVRLGGDSVALVAARTPANETASATYRVWLWRSGRWLPLGSPGPTVRIGQGIAYDAARRRLVLFGGAAEGADRSFADVWEFDGASWRQASPGGGTSR